MKARVLAFLCWMSGVNAEALSRAPSARNDAALQGALLSLLSGLAAVTGSYAIYSVFAGDRFALGVAIALGMAWGALVYCIDRRLITTINVSASRWNRALQLAVRLPLAAVVALVISTPVILRVSRQPIQADLRRIERVTYQDEARTNAQYERVAEARADVDALSVDVAQRSERLRGVPDTYEYRLAAEELAAATKAFESTATINSRRIASAQAEVGRLEYLAQGASLTPAQLDQLDRLRRSVTSWRREIGLAAAARARARTAETRVREEWLDEQRDGLASAQEKLTQAEQYKSRTIERVAQRDAESERLAARLTTPTLVNQYRVLRRITGDRTHPDAAALRAVEWSLHTLFFVLEVLAVGLKLLSPSRPANRKSPLESAIEAIEFEEIEKMNVTANANVARYQAAAELAARVEASARALYEKQKVAAHPGRTWTVDELKALQKELEQLLAA